MTYLVVAESEELALPWAKAYSGCPAIITGPGIVNVIRALTGLDRKADIVNVGYCGAVGLPVGTEVGGVPYTVIVETAREYIHNLGGFEKFAEYGLIRP